MKKKLKTLLLTIVLGVIAFGLTGCGGTTVDLNKYVTIDVTGYDSMGQVNVTFDEKAFEEDYKGKIVAKINEQGGEAAMMSLELQCGAEPYAVMRNYCIKYTVDKTSGLSNGDVIKIVWDCKDENAKKFFNCNLKYSNIEYKVKELTEAASFNPFEYVTVDIEGIAPDGYVTITPNYDRKEMQYLSFSADKTNGLSNGDTVVVTANVQGNVEGFVQQFNSIPSPASMEYTVKGLTAYVTSVAEIDETTLNAMKQQAEDVYKASWVKLNGNMDGLQALTYLGYYFLSKKENAYTSENNQMYMVYKVDYTYEGESYPHYVFIKFKNLSIDEAGKCVVDLNNYDEVTHKWSVAWWMWFYGYETLDELYNECVVAEMNEYTYESSMVE